MWGLFQDWYSTSSVHRFTRLIGSLFCCLSAFLNICKGLIDMRIAARQVDLKIQYAYVILSQRKAKKTRCIINFLRNFRNFNNNTRLMKLLLTYLYACNSLLSHFFRKFFSAAIIDDYHPFRSVMTNRLKN